MRKFLIGLSAAAMTAVAALAIPHVAGAFNPADYTGNGAPQFNVYRDVEGVGDEHDFLRIGAKDANSSTYSNDFQACDGEARLSVYIHNGAPEIYNGANNDGTGVARDSKIKVSVPKTSASPFSAVISASNAVPQAVTDGAKITCNGAPVEFEYVPGSAQIYTLDRKLAALSDSVVSPAGAALGSISGDGLIPGCWHFRNYVTLTVKIKKVTPPAPVYTCDGLTPVLIDQKTNKYKFTAKASVKDATVKSYVFDFGDSKTQTVNSSALTATSEEHTFTQDSTVRVTVHFTANGKEVTSTGTQCTVQIKMNQPPVVPPVTPPVTSIPETGAGSTIAAVGAISALAYGFRRWLDSRKALRA